MSTWSRKQKRTVYLAALASATFQFLSNSVEAQQGASYTPPAAPPVWGDLNRDKVVDLRDLVLLGKDWGKTEEPYGQASTGIRNDIATHWRRNVPEVLNALGWENRPITASFSSTKFVAGTKKSSGANLPKAVGFGVTFPEGSVSEVIGQPVFEIPQGLTPVRRQFSGLEGGYNDENAFYNYPLEKEESKLQYIRSYEEQQEFFGVDLSLEAKYGIFSGSLRTNTEREKYREGRSHKLLYSSTKSFGWVFLPPSERVLNPDFLDALEALEEGGSQGLFQTFGTHYVYAEHRVGSLLIDLDFTTSLARDRSSFKLEVEANLNAAAYSANLAAAITQLKQTVKDVTSIRIRIHRRGGSPDLTLSDGRSFAAVAASLDANSENLQSEVSKLIEAWSSDLNFGNAAVDNFYCRPISDFIDSSTVLPWERGKNLRDWYKRWAELYDLAAGSYGVLNPAGTDFTYPHRHFHLVNQSTAPEGAESWLGYFQNKRVELRQTRDDLLALGRAIYESDFADTSVQFDPNFDFPLPEMRFPRILFNFATADLVTCTMQTNWQQNKMQWNFYGKIQNGNFANNGEYAWKVVRNPRLNVWNCPYWLVDQGEQIQYSVTSGVNSTDIRVWQDAGENGGCCQYLNRWANNDLDDDRAAGTPGRPAFTIGLIDVAVTPNRLIAVGCASNLCQGIDLAAFGVMPAPYL